MLSLDNSLSSLRVTGTKECREPSLSSWAVVGLNINKWSKCFGSIRQRYARERVTPCRRSSAGWIPARIGKQSVDVGRWHPVTILMASLRTLSTRQV